jgi:hypothetical protein
MLRIFPQHRSTSSSGERWAGGLTAGFILSGSRPYAISGAVHYSIESRRHSISSHFIFLPFYTLSSLFFFIFLSPS